MVTTEHVQTKIHHADVKSEHDGRGSQGKFTLLASAGAVGAITVCEAVAFTVWSNATNAITWRSLEDSTRPVYPAHAHLVGWMQGLALSASFALVVLLLDRTFMTRKAKAKHVTAPSALLMAASIGAAVPITIHWSVFMATPCVVVALVAAAIRYRWMRTRSV